MRNILLALFLLLCVYGFAGTVFGGEKVKSLRGQSDIPAVSNPSVDMDWQEKDEAIERTFVHQPPLIPHEVEEYHVSVSKNDCLECHGDSGSDAPQPHSSHFMDRDDKKTDNVSSRWYFCSQCHVGQVEVDPLIENTFESK